MDKRRNNILIWLITWASLLLLVLYSPVGSPDMYNKGIYYSSNQGVIFEREGIPNASAYRTASKINNNISVPTNLVETTVSPYSINSSLSETKRRNVNGTPPSTTQILKNQSKGAGSSEGGFGSVASGVQKKDNNSVSNNGLSSMSTDLSSLTNNNTFRKGAGGLNEPIVYPTTTDPGSDPTGPVIPIPDGWGFLLALALAYGVLKRSFFMKS